MEYTTTNIDRAADQFRAGEQALLRPDGTHKYGDAEHTERVQALLATFDRTGEAAVQHAETLIAESERTVHALAHGDPTDRLSADDLAAANAKRAFVAEDAERLPLGDLAARCTVALAAGDTATIFLLARYARKRGEAVLAALRNGTRMSNEDTAALGDLDAALKQLDTRIADPHAASKRTQAEAAIKEARALRMHASRVRQEIDGSTAANMRRLRQRYGI